MPSDDVDTFVQQEKYRLDDELYEFGQFLAQRRNDLDLTQTAMAQKIGVDQSTISRLEKGVSMPGDLAIIGGIIRGYRLSREEQHKLHQLYAIEKYDLYEIEVNKRVVLAATLIEKIQDILHISANRAKYDYFDSLRYRQRYSEIDDIWSELEPVIPWLEGKSGLLPRYLAVELARSTVHYLDVRGYYRARMIVASRGADAAHELGMLEYETPLLGDGKAWSTMHLLNNPMLVRGDLERSRALAEETGNTNMLGVMTAWLADSYLLERSFKEAECYIQKAEDISKECLFAVQARIYLVEGRIARALKERETAIAYYSRSKKATLEFTGNAYPEIVASWLELGELYLEDNEFARAKEEFSAALRMTQAVGLSPHEAAWAKFGLARIAALEGDFITANMYGQKAYSLLQEFQVHAPLYQKVIRFLDGIKQMTRSQR